MKYASLTQTTFVLRLDPGDDVLGSVEQLCDAENVTNASVQGIGSVESPTLAHYSIKTKQFTKKQLTGIFEITSLLGNVALVDSRPVVHVHVNLSDEQMQTYGGHLVGGACSATLEIILTAYPSMLTKTHQAAIGLPVWDLD